MSRPSTREHKIIIASWNSIFGNAFLSVTKIVTGFFFGSMALVADGVDSASDIITSLITLLTARIISKPPDMKYPYGYEKADTIASKLLAFIIFFAGAQLAITTVHRLLEGQTSEMPSLLAVFVIVFSIVGKQFLSFYLNRVGKKTDSEMLRSNAKNMQGDVIISSSVLVGLVFTHIFKMPVLDLITALAVSGWIMFVAIRIIVQSSRTLMDRIEDPGIYKSITEAVASVPDAHHPHRIRARKIAHLYVIDLDIEVEGAFSLDKAHQIAHQVENEIKARIENVYDVLVHAEPLGDDASHEVFGVSEKDL
ncbi:MAG: cation diffusion facilitator family transporter [Bacteroidales bacterium]